MERLPRKEIRELKKIKCSINYELNGYSNYIKDIYDTVFGQIKSRINKGEYVKMNGKTNQDCNLKKSIDLFVGKIPPRIKQLSNRQTKNISINKLTRFAYYDLDVKSPKDVAMKIKEYIMNSIYPKEEEVYKKGSLEQFEKDYQSALENIAVKVLNYSGMHF